MSTTSDELLRVVLQAMFDALSAVSAEADFLKAERWALLEATKESSVELHRKIEQLRSEANYRSILNTHEARLSTLGEMLGRLS
jgi:hypothetical protein